MTKKLTYEYVKEQIEKEGYKLISKEYINSKNKLRLKCDRDHECEITYSNFKKGKRCYKCKGRRISKKLKLKYESVKEQIEKEGYKLLSKEYINNRIRLRLKCDRDHECEITYSNFKKGHRCPICYFKYRSGYNNNKWKGGVTKKNIPLYDTYAYQIDFAEKVRRNKEDKNILEVKCTYCGKWHIPKRTNVSGRIRSLNGDVIGENRLYCSTGCKKECPIYYKQKYSAEETNTKRYSREVQPELRQMVFERDNWECKKCKSTKSLHCHHVEGIRYEPLESADIDKCITLCKKCHKEVHKKDDCRTSDMRCSDEKMDKKMRGGSEQIKL